MPWAGAGCSGPEKWGVRALCVPWTACSCGTHLMRPSTLRRPSQCLFVMYDKCVCAVLCPRSCVCMCVCVCVCVF